MKNSAKKIRNDFILVFSILALALVCFLIFKACAKEGTTVVITIDGEIYKSLPLNEDTVIEVQSGETGEWKNTVTVKDGKVIVSYANCPDGICESHRPIRYKGESIVCLPHKVVITVESGESSDVDISIK